jgi:hypothetical protein
VQKLRTRLPILRPIDRATSDASQSYTPNTADESLHLRALLLGSYSAHELVRQMETYVQGQINHPSTRPSDSCMMTTARVENCRSTELLPPDKEDYAVRTMWRMDGAGNWAEKDGNYDLREGAVSKFSL